MSIRTIVRTQHPVGQGFFSSTRFLDENGDVFSDYVYDCGAFGKFRSAREHAIDAYIASIPSRRIDLVFISHFHLDHTAGLERLLDPDKGLRTDAVVLPLTNAVRRLFAFAQNARHARHENALAAQVDLAVDPVAAVSLFSDNVIVVNSGGPAAPGANGEPQNLRPVADDLAQLNDGQRNWHLLHPAQAAQGDGTVRIDDGNPIVFASDDVVWLLSLYVDKADEDREAIFLAKLQAALKAHKKKLDLSIDELRTKLNDDSAFMNLLLTEYQDAVYDAYEAYNKTAKSGFNQTSMSLLSIPNDGVTGHLIWKHGKDGRSSTKRLGWLATGDAELEQKTRRTNFFDHYGALLGRVHTYAPPHHGSDYNFDESLVKTIRPELGIVGVDKYKGWDHPDPLVTKQFKETEKIPLQSVTSTSPALVETITLDP